jgi:hypothetical protein
MDVQSRNHVVPEFDALHGLRVSLRNARRNARPTANSPLDSAHGTGQYRIIMTSGRPFSRMTRPNASHLSLLRFCTQDRKNLWGVSEH